jgi:hypothetical protein
VPRPAQLVGDEPRRAAHVVGAQAVEIVPPEEVRDDGDEFACLLPSNVLDQHRVHQL